MIHSLILSDRRNNQYKTLGILIFIIYPILSFPFILKGILKRERWAYLLGAILMGYIGMLYPPAGDMYRYAEDFNLYKELDWEYFWIFMATLSTILCKWKQDSVVSSSYIWILFSNISINWFIINPQL